MARRRRSSWASVVQRSMTAMTKVMLRAGGQAFGTAAAQAAGLAVRRAKAARPATRRARPVPAAAPALPLRRRARPTPGKAAGTAAREAAALAAGGGRWQRGSVVGPAGARQFQLYTPPAAAGRRPAPLLVMLHGCGQTARAMALSTRMNRLAARAGWFVLYPSQDRRAHPQGCWNWYATRSGLAQAEAATLLAAVDQVLRRHPVDPARVAVAGLSAGAGMAALLASLHPARFRAVVMHSGVPVGAATSTASALQAMFGRRAPEALATEEGGAAALPPLLVIHGTADPVVAPANARLAAEAWAAAAGAQASAPRALQRGQRHPMTVTDYRRRGRLAATLCEVHGLAHAWSGGAAGQDHGDARGPDASRLVMAFAARQFGLAPAAADGRA